MYTMNPKQIREITRYIFLEDPIEKADVIFIPGCARPEHTEEAARLYREGYAPVLIPSGGYTKLEGGFRGVKKGAGRYGSDFDCEADFLEAVLLANGVPKEAILKEKEATYTLENAEKSRELILRTSGEKTVDSGSQEKTGDGGSREKTGDDGSGEKVRDGGLGRKAGDSGSGEKVRDSGVVSLSGIPRRAIVCCKAHHARRCYMYYSMVFPETVLMMHPVTVDGIGPESWFRTEAGRRTVLGELSRVGEQLLMMEGRIRWES